MALIDLKIKSEKQVEEYYRNISNKKMRGGIKYALDQADKELMRKLAEEIKSSWVSIKVIDEGKGIQVTLDPCFYIEIFPIVCNIIVNDIPFTRCNISGILTYGKDKELDAKFLEFMGKFEGFLCEELYPTELQEEIANWERCYEYLSEISKSTSPSTVRKKIKGESL